MLTGIVGDKRTVINQLFKDATPQVLVIDCANAANPHRLKIPQENLTNFHIIPIELLYAFRDITRNLPKNYKTIIITPIDILFNYHDEKENLAIYSQAWDNLRKSKENIIIGITKGSMHEKYAKLYCDKIIMGHTAYSQRVNLHLLQQELRAYSQILSPEDKANFEKLLIYPLQHIGSITFASSIHAWAFQTLSVSLELYKQNLILKEQQEQLEDRLKILEGKLEVNNDDVVSGFISQQQQNNLVAQSRSK